MNPELVVRDEGGNVNTVRYDQVNAMLLNEFLKEHKASLADKRKLQAQEVTIGQLRSTVEEQQKGIESIIARLKEQGGQLQRVGAQVELNRTSRQQTSLTNP